jgi:hypothetical protein
MKLLNLFEASNASSGLKSVIAYLEKKLGTKLVKIMGNDYFTNSKEKGVGIRYVQSGTTKCIRFNWDSSPGNISAIKSIDIFNGNSKDPSYNIKIDGVPLMRALPAIVKTIKDPDIGDIEVSGLPVKVAESLSESVDRSANQIVSDLLRRFGKGERISRDDFATEYHQMNLGIFDHIVKDFKDRFDKHENGDYELIYPKRAEELRNEILGDSAKVTVSKGGNSETYSEGGDVAVNISYTDSLEHLDSLVRALIKGSFNAMFITGKGGTGKTQTVEKALHEEGLSDGQGYLKIAGAASAPGIYTALYRNRHSIILFDDSDGALADVDARNIIKAATDTKKVRKISWNKKSSFIFNPLGADAKKHFNDPDMAPSSFEFYGRIIFISNLSLSKLDPDGSLRTRAFIVNIDPTDDEMIAHMEKILPDIKLEQGLSLTPEEREHVLSVVKKNKRDGLSLRKLVRALNLAASGEPGWEKLVQLYA